MGGWGAARFVLNQLGSTVLQNQERLNSLNKPIPRVQTFRSLNLSWNLDTGTQGVPEKDRMERRTSTSSDSGEGTRAPRMAQSVSVNINCKRRSLRVTLLALN